MIDRVTDLGDAMPWMQSEIKHELCRSHVLYLTSPCYNLHVFGIRSLWKQESVEGCVSSFVITPNITLDDVVSPQKHAWIWRMWMYQTALRCYCTKKVMQSLGRLPVTVHFKTKIIDTVLYKGKVQWTFSVWLQISCFKCSFVWI